MLKARVERRIADRVQLSALAERDVQYAVLQAGTADEQSRNTFVLGRYRGGATLDMPFDTVGEGFVEFNRARYVLPYEERGVLISRVDRLWTVGATLTRPVGRSLRVGAYLTRIRRSSALQGFSFDSTRFGLRGSWIP